MCSEQKGFSMSTDRHRHDSQAWRLILTELNDDEDAGNFLIGDVGGCPWDWYLVAATLARLIRDELRAQVALLELDEDPIRGWVAHQIALALDAEDAA